MGCIKRYQIYVALNSSFAIRIYLPHLLKFDVTFFEIIRLDAAIIQLYKAILACIYF